MTYLTAKWLVHYLKRNKEGVFLMAFDLNIACKNAKTASKFLSTAQQAVKNYALNNIAEDLIKNSDYICKENEKDLLKAKDNSISDVMLDRLRLTPERIEGIADGVRKIIALPDPVGEVVNMVKRPNGLLIGKKRVPLGVVGVIYESRPNVTVDTAALCLKSSNAVVLRGGSEAFYSNLALSNIMKNAIEKAGIPSGAITFVEDTSRDVATQMMRLNEYIDVLIPRGGAGLIKAVVNNATIPVIETGVGNCHIYVDDECDMDMAVKIIINAKTSRPSVCNAIETVLINKNIDNAFYKKLEDALNEKNVEIRACEFTKEKMPSAKTATNEDYATEFLDYILAIKSVDSIDEAIIHIDMYGTKHSEAIITDSYKKASKFQESVDAAAVYVNASTRFTDGFEFGFGAEIGISTQKIHARGPMGLNELTTFKYIIQGDGQIR